MSQFDHSANGRRIRCDFFSASDVPRTPDGAPIPGIPERNSYLVVTGALGQFRPCYVIAPSSCPICNGHGVDPTTRRHLCRCTAAMLNPRIAAGNGLPEVLNLDRPAASEPGNVTPSDETADDATVDNDTTSAARSENPDSEPGGPERREPGVLGLEE